MIKYVDFDGVIFDTEPKLFNDKYYEMKKEPNFDKMKYVQDINWDKLIRNSKEINNAISILKELKSEVEILTKVNSLDNEAVAKIKILRELGIENKIILVPFNLKKTDIVSAKGNILVDDTIHNLDDWYKDGGIPIFFNKNNNDMDSWFNTNTKYKKIKTLEYLKEI